MRLKISELNSEFQDRFFDMSAGRIPDRGTVFHEGNIQCRLTAKTVENGFEISGELYATPEYECVRCLVKIPVPLKLPIQIILSKSKGILPDKNDVEFLYFNEDKKYIELDNFIADLIELDRPINPLCQVNCEGLCAICGRNKNKSCCSCRIQEKNTGWDKLKDFKVK